jgi:hypothetical protein
MANKIHDYNDEKVKKKDLKRGEAVPGTGHEIKQLKQKG